MAQMCLYMKSISVIIPNYNGADLLKDNLPYVFSSLSKSSITDFELIIPDDASSDNSISFIENNYPEIILVKNKVNKGFSGNVNSGIKLATKDLILILNSDVQLIGNYFSPLIKYFDKEDTFGVMGKIIALNSNKHKDGAKYPYYSFGKIKTTKNYSAGNKNSLYSFFLSGANALIDRKKLLKLGGFNELYNPYYYEDADLGISAWRAGYKIYYENNAVCRHPSSATISKQAKNKVKIIAKRNKIILHYLHLGKLESFLFLAFYSLVALLRLFILDFIYFKSTAMFWKNFKTISNYKKQMKKYRTKTLREVVRLIKNDLNENEVSIF